MPAVGVPEYARGRRLPASISPRSGLAPAQDGGEGGTEGSLMNEPEGSPMSETDGGVQAMLAVARAALARAHAPYSRFRVGARLRTASGRLHGGCNVENAAYPVGQCAESTAIGVMVVAGDREIVEALVLTEGPALCPPCGGLPPAAGRVAGPATPVDLAGPGGGAGHHHAGRPLAPGLRAGRHGRLRCPGGPGPR